MVTLFGEAGCGLWEKFNRSGLSAFWSHFQTHPPYTHSQCFGKKDFFSRKRFLRLLLKDNIDRVFKKELGWMFPALGLDYFTNWVFSF
jgi:hypothetical protein